MNAYRVISSCGDCSRIAPCVAASCLAKPSCYRLLPVVVRRYYSLCCPVIPDKLLPTVINRLPCTRRFVVGCMELDWVVGWVGLWVQRFYFGWVGLG